MREGFATIYDRVFGIYNTQYDLVFQHLFDNGSYIKLGLLFILVPLTFWTLFYYAWRYPYGRIWHWLIWLVVTVIVVFGATYGIANKEIFSSDNQDLNDALADAATGYENYASVFPSLPLLYALINSLLAITVGVILSLIMKQFSKIQTHLPL